MDQKAAVLLYALIAGVAAVAWLPAFSHLCRHPELLKPNLPPGIFPSRVKRPATAIICQILAAAPGWFVHPILAVALFTFVVLYHAWTSQGIPSGR